MDTTGIQSRIRLESGVTWPVLETEKVNAITITFVAGYGAAGANVPENLRQSLYALCAHWFENRIPALTGTISTSLPIHIQHMLMPEAALLTY